MLIRWSLTLAGKQSYSTSAIAALEAAVQRHDFQTYGWPAPDSPFEKLARQGRSPCQVANNEGLVMHI